MSQRHSSEPAMTWMVSSLSMLAIDARDVEKTFRSGWFRRRETQALRGVSLAVERGSIFGLLGPNGAGKTTLLSILATLLTPDRGQVLVLGHDVVREASVLRRRLNMASGRPSFLWSVRVGEHIAKLRREQGITIVLTTHYMREADELCDEIAFIKAGRILSRGTPGELKRQIRLGEVIALRLDPPVMTWLAEAPGVLRCVEADGWVECTVDEAEKRLPELLRALHNDGVVIRNVQVREPELEEVFVELAK